MKILMVAAENDALPGAKVGGIGDVVRDIPIALAEAGHEVSVVIPGYGALSTLKDAQFMGRLNVTYAGHLEAVDIYKIKFQNGNDSTSENGGEVTQWVLEHPLFAAGGIGKVYCDDPGDRPFATDASKFALFCAAVATGVVEMEFGDIDILHLHDWHAAMVAVLRAYDAKFASLRSIHTVYTIHNLALQGVRPFSGDESSMDHWFRGMTYQGAAICDPAYPQCFNPMRAGINLCDRVHAVSVNYANEIVQPSDHYRGYYGGEGLEQDLRRAKSEGRLQGILNGCEYPQSVQDKKALPLSELLLLIEDELLKWVSKSPSVQSAHFIAMSRLRRLLAKSDKQLKKDVGIVLTSIGRITSQKVRLFEQRMDDGRCALSHFLDKLDEKTEGKGLFILLGSGDKQLEGFLTEVAAKHSNLLYLQGYSQSLSDNLYPVGDLFIMPSSFEPCGISQMLAMRSGQPCLAHGVGGLSDTIAHEDNGFIFKGSDPLNQAEQMLVKFEDALNIFHFDELKWQGIAGRAFESRFLWSDAAAHYVNKLYDNEPK